MLIQKVKIEKTVSERETGSSGRLGSASLIKLRFAEAAAKNIGQSHKSVTLALIFPRTVLSCQPQDTDKGAFPPSHFSNKLDDKLAHKVALQKNVTHFCLVCQSEVCCKPNRFATNTLRQLCQQVCYQV
jgi:hypothetical protein